MSYETQNIRPVNNHYGVRGTVSGAGSFTTNNTETIYEVIIDDTSWGEGGNAFLPEVTFYPDEVVTDVKFHTIEAPTGALTSASVELVDATGNAAATGVDPILITSGEMVAGAAGSPANTDAINDRVLIAAHPSVFLIGTPDSVGKTIVTIKTLRLSPGNGTDADSPIHQP